MKIPAPMIPPITAMVVPNNPILRTSPPPWSARLPWFSVISSNLACASRGGAASIGSLQLGRTLRPQLPATKLGDGSLPPGWERYFLRLKSPHNLCDKGVVDVLPGGIERKAFTVLGLRGALLPLAHALMLGVLCEQLSGPLTRQWTGGICLQES